MPCTNWSGHPNNSGKKWKELIHGPERTIRRGMNRCLPLPTGVLGHRWGRDRTIPRHDESGTAIQPPVNHPWPELSAVRTGSPITSGGRVWDWGRRICCPDNRGLTLVVCGIHRVVSSVLHQRGGHRCPTEVFEEAAISRTWTNPQLMNQQQSGTVMWHSTRSPRCPPVPVQLGATDSAT